MINVTRTYLPPLEEFNRYLERIWKSHWITNEGPLLKELEQGLSERLHVKHLQFVTNGTIAIQIAIKALELKGEEVITTPFSYVATTNCLMWENYKPVFADIEPDTFGIDPEKIEAMITPRTSAILATHVYGFPCQTEKIATIAKKHNLKIIYDGAHAFGVKVNGRSLVAEGDVTTLSFHATKVYHTVEGGAIVTPHKEIHDKMFLLKVFGHLDDRYLSAGINGKNSEVHAAMGLCNLKIVDQVIEIRKQKHLLYHSLLEGSGIMIPEIPQGVEYNYSYFPVLFDSEARLLKVVNYLIQNGVKPRRYFYPSLNTISYVKGESCPVSEEIAPRVLCLPFYHELEDKDIERIVSLVIKSH